MIQWHRRDIIMMIVLIALTVSRKLIALTRWRNSAPTPLTQTTCNVGAELTIQWRPNSGLSKHQSIDQSVCFWKNSQTSVLHSELSAKSLNRGKHHLLRNILHLCYTLSNFSQSMFCRFTILKVPIPRYTSYHTIRPPLEVSAISSTLSRYIIKSFPLHHQAFTAISSSLSRYIVKHFPLYHQVIPAISSSLSRYIIKSFPLYHKVFPAISSSLLFVTCVSLVFEIVCWYYKYRIFFLINRKSPN